MSNDRTDKILSSAYSRLSQARALDAGQAYIVVDSGGQRLLLCRDRQVLSEYPVSTAAGGLGCQVDSYMTPTGIHRVMEKIGGDQPPGMIFEGRVATGREADILAESVDSGTDLITSRILWLEGMESGINQGPGVDSRERYIYIHGTNEEGRLGQAVSHGCVRMANADVIALYDEVEAGTPVLII